MVPVVVATLVLVAASAAVGAAVWRLAGLAPAPHLSAAVGYAALIVVAEPVTRLPGWAATALGVLIAITVLALLYRPAREDLRAGLADFVPIVLGGLVLVCLPFLVSGHFGVLAMGNNDDLAQHFPVAAWLMNHDVPQGDTVAGWGYPLGSHSLAAVVSAVGISVPEAFTAVIAAAPILAALAAFSALGEASRRLRWALALLVGFTYLYASYYAQAAHKEVMAGCLVLAFPLALPATARAVASRGPRGAARAGIPAAVIAAGAVQVISWPGALWPLVTLCAWGALAVLAGQHRRLLAAWRAVVLALAGAGVAFAVMLAPAVQDIIGFQNSSFAHEPPEGHGNLESRIPPNEALGVWLQADFRFATHAPLLAYPLMAGALALVVVGLVHWWRRGPRALVGGFAANWFVWIVITAFKNPYNSAKALAVLSPLLALALVAGAIAAWGPLRRRGAARREAGVEEVELPEVPAPAMYGVLGMLPRGRWGERARHGGIVLVLAAAAVSSLWALRDAVVGPDAHASELRTLAKTAQPNQTVLLDPSDYGWWDLYPLSPRRPRLLYVVHTVPLREQKHWHAGQALDLDSLTSDTLNRYRWFVTSRTPFASTPPPGIRRVRSTASYTLWERVGHVPQRETLDEGWQPGRTLDCSTPDGRALSRKDGTALVRAKPVIAPGWGWRGQPRNAGSSASRVLRLPRGEWDLSLQYVSRNPLEVTAGTLRRSLPASLDRMSPFFLLGTVVSTGRPITVTVHADQLGLIGRLLGARSGTRALNSPNLRPLGMLAATRHGDKARSIPLSKACGRYVDAYTLSG